MRPRIRTNTLTEYAELARSSGLDPAALVAGVGLDIADLEVPDRWIPAAPAAWLLDLSARRADLPDFACAWPPSAGSERSARSASRSVTSRTCAAPWTS